MNAVELLVAAARMADGRPVLEVAVELASQARDLEDVLLCHACELARCAAAREAS